jgi:superfamily II DNA or RNA helicase
MMQTEAVETSNPPESEHFRPGLYDWQEAHADQLVEAMCRHGFAMDGSDTGTGKTVIALEVAHRIGRIPFVVCPKSVIPSWVEMMKLFRHDDPSYFAFNYEKIRGGKTPYLVRKGKKVAWQLDPNLCMLIFDEVHRCKSDKSLNSKMLAQAKDAGIPVLMLSATACSNPVEMKAAGYLMDMHQYKNYWNWCLKTGCVKGVFGGLKFNNSSGVLKKLHDHIYPDRGSRIRIKSLPEGTFPDNLVIPQGYNVDDPSAFDQIYTDMAEELKALAERTEEDSDEESPLTIQLRARQKAELLKVPVFTELAEDALSERNSVAIFVNFTATLEALAARLSAIAPVVLVQGGQSEADRADMVDAFQRDSAHVIICTIQAGGVGLNLHDRLGNRPRVSLISPSFSAIDLKQALGRIHRSGGKSPAIQKIIFAADSVEMRVCQSVRRKLTNLDLINDDELNPLI